MNGAVRAGTAQGGGPAARPPGDRARLDLGRLVRRVITANEAWTLLALVILVVVFTIRSPRQFFSLNDFSLIAQNSAALLMMAIGETFVILFGRNGVDAREPAIEIDVGATL